jgi:prepilin-type N-terminal cleavage/methylation domain-containing protein
MNLSVSQKLRLLRRIDRRGFTLIEMMISVTLVLLMMLMFAEIFELASDSMTLQRALATNDQRVRSFTTVFRSDLQKRTFRDVVPYHPLENQEDASSELGKSRDGYIYISLNDPDNAVDNFLQFTTRPTLRNDNTDDTSYFGRATPLVQLTSTVLTERQIRLNLRRNPQQPEFDDEQLEPNFTATSSAAEVAYYVRGGRLYRRVILIRDSIDGDPDPRLEVDTDASPNVAFADPPRYFSHTGPDAQAPLGFYNTYDPRTGSTVASNDYWADFSFSSWAEGSLASSSFNGARLVGIDALKNNRNDSTFASLGLVRASTSTGIRCYRFGFDQWTGVSREFSTDNPSDLGHFFLGRYTAEEMSHPDFNYPQAPSSLGGSNPMSYAANPNGVPTLVDSNQDGTVDVLANGSRRGEDLLLSNVHAFEIDLWDERQGAFVTPGHQLVPPVGGLKGDYHIDRNLQLAQGFSYVPGDPAAWNTSGWPGRVFDTWHSRNVQDLDGDGDDDPVMPPYRPTTYRLDDGIGATSDADEKFRWQPNTSYQDSTSGPPSIVFPDLKQPQDSSRYYVCMLSPVPPATSGTSGAIEPNWPTEPGTRFYDGNVLWVVRSNVRRLRAIRVRVRFLHEASGKMRQLSLVHSLTD